MQSSGDFPQYSEENHETWRNFFKEARKSWATHNSIIHPFYRDNAYRLEEFSNRIPTLDQLNSALSAIGWSSRYVDGLVPGWEIADLLQNKIMPVSRKIRPAEELHFASEPDLIHDIFGHFPTLFADEYRDLLSRWARPSSALPIYEGDRANYHLNKMMVLYNGLISDKSQEELILSSKHLCNFLVQNPTPSQTFDKAYFWIFEFGIIQQADQRLVLGAGILSSLNELEKLAFGDCELEELNSENILESYNISSHQDKYLVVPYLDRFHAILEEIAGSASLNQSGGLHAE
ncbi:MAG: hypothetical protein EOP10_05345 [Proteobacteria bacterium]|nr:MAG: hypothetical protein EOP10_05345 [Pseudomonadota bacterium]